MSIQIVCPNCKTSYNLAGDPEGKKVRCKKCDTVFTAQVPEVTAAEAEEEETPSRSAKAEKEEGDSARRRPKGKAEKKDEEAIESKERSRSRSVAAPPRRGRDRDDDEYDDEPRRRKKIARKGMSPAGLTFLIIGIVAALCTATAGIFLVVWFFYFDNKDTGSNMAHHDPVIIKPRAGGGGGPLDVGDGDDDVEDPKKDHEKPDPNVKDPPPPPNAPRNLEFVSPLPKEAVVSKPPGPATPELPLEVVTRVKRSTVMLRVTMADGNMGSGSGFFGGEQGVILTNAHVVGMLRPESGPPKSIDVAVNSGTPEEKRFKGELLGVDRSVDLAVLRVAGADMPPPLTVKSAKTLRETQKVWTVGFPLGDSVGKEITVSDSSVSSFRRDENGELTRLQVNGGLTHGNSGGPVVDSFGNVVGVAVSVFHGTQINFAVPGDYVSSILHGRISSFSLGQPYLKDGVPRVSVTISMIDPLTQVQEPGLEVWTGNSGQGTRPPTRTKPAVEPGDSPHQRFAFEYQNEAARGEIKLDSLEFGKTYWIQPTWKNVAGEAQWATARVLELPTPVDLRPANLQVKHQVGNWQLAFNSWVDMKLMNQEKGEFRILTNTEAQLIEKIQSIDDNTEVANAVLEYRSYNSQNRYNNQTPPPDKKSQRIRQEIHKVRASFQIDKHGNQQNHNLSAERTPRDLQGEIGFVNMTVGQCVDAVSIPLPNKQVAPGETWKGERGMPSTRFTPWFHTGKIEITYTYVGARKNKGRDEGVVTFQGRAGKSEGQASQLGGRAEGIAVIDLATGQVSEASGRFIFDMDTSLAGAVSAHANGSVQVRVKRTPWTP